MTPNGCFVTGTDTGVGKTRVSAALIAHLVATGRRVHGFKPIAAGASLVNGVVVNEDVRALHAVSSPGVAETEVGPFQFEAACAPHVAAKLENRSIDRHAVLSAGRALQSRCDFLVAEGVGGFRVPLGPGFDTAHLAADLGLPVVLVVGVRLGCINHAFITAEVIQARGLRVAGWIANTIDPHMLHLAHTLAALHDELSGSQGLPCLGTVPWLDDPSPAAVASHLDARALQRAFFA